MMKKKVIALCVVVIALLPLFFIMPTMTGSSPRVPTDLYIGGLRGHEPIPVGQQDPTGQIVDHPTPPIVGSP
jgi:hypothetical protein